MCYQVGSQSFPALRATGTATVLLPEWATRFRGRAEELDRLTERVPQERVVVLTGPGGLGKTRLAAQIAQRLLEEFPDGVYFVGLAGIDADTVDNAIAEGLHVRREPRRSLLESVIGWLRDRHVLIVLDNCEQVIAAAHIAVETLSKTVRVFTCWPRAAFLWVFLENCECPCLRSMSRRLSICSWTAWS